MKNKIQHFIKKAKKLLSEVKNSEVSRPMLKFSELAVAALTFIHSANNMTILLLLIYTMPKIAKIGIIIYLVISNIIIYKILRRFARIWIK